MALVTTADIQDEMPTFVFTNASRPTLAQVENYIDDVEAEVRSLAQDCQPGLPWPVDATTPQGKALRITVLEGVRWRALRARYAMVRTDAQPTEEIAQARDAYNDRLRRLCSVVAGMAAQTWAAQTVPAQSFPLIGDQPAAPNLAGSLFDYTLRRHQGAEWGSAGRVLRP